MNKKRLIFFDDEPQTNKRLRQDLVKDGFEVVCPQTVEEAFKEIVELDARVIVHCAHNTETYWKIYDAINQAFPQFPTLHIAISKKGEDYQRQFKGTFHQHIRPLAPAHLFVKKVKRLFHLASLQKQNEGLKKKLEIYEKTEPLLQSITLFDLKQKMTLLFLDLFSAHNVLFFDQGEIDYFLKRQKDADVIELNNVSMPEHRVIAAKQISVEEIQNFLRKVTQDLPAGWQQRKKNHFTVTQKNEQFFVVPICGVQNKKILGHAIVLGPLHGDIATNSLVPHLQHVIGRHAEHIQMLHHAKGLSYIDDLTDLYNQRYLKLVLDKEINRSQRTDSCFSVLFMDIDHFKRVNDTRGHIVGSKVLVELSKIIHENIRTVDYGFRYGGDEFLMILIGTKSDQAKVVAERMRKQVEASVFDIEGIQIKVTLSIGIASYPQHAQTKEQILELADEAMYVGKKKSRNIVYVAS